MDGAYRLDLTTRGWDRLSEDRPMVIPAINREARLPAPVVRRRLAKDHNPLFMPEAHRPSTESLFPPGQPAFLAVTGMVALPSRLAMGQYLSHNRDYRWEI